MYICSKWKCKLIDYETLLYSFRLFVLAKCTKKLALQTMWWLQPIKLQFLSHPLNIYWNTRLISIVITFPFLPVVFMTHLLCNGWNLILAYHWKTERKLTVMHFFLKNDIYLAPDRPSLNLSPLLLLQLEQKQPPHNLPKQPSPHSQG